MKHPASTADMPANEAAAEDNDDVDIDEADLAEELEKAMQDDDQHMGACTAVYCSM